MEKGKDLSVLWMVSTWCSLLWDIMEADMVSRYSGREQQANSESAGPHTELRQNKKSYIPSGISYTVLIDGGARGGRSVDSGSLCVDSATSVGLVISTHWAFYIFLMHNVVKVIRRFNYHQFIKCRQRDTSFIS